MSVRAAHRLALPATLPPGLAWPDPDPALPGLDGFHSARLAATLAELGLAGRPLRVEILKYHPGRRCTLAVDTTRGQLIVKVLSRRSERLLETLALVADELPASVTAPRVLATRAQVHLVVTDAFTGLTADQLLGAAEGARAGQLAAQWIEAAHATRLPTGRVLRPETLVNGRRAGAEAIRDVHTRAALLGLLDMLLANAPPPSGAHLVHCSLKPAHLFEEGATTGMIDWDGAHRGAIEHDAATFLAYTALDVHASPERAAAGRVATAEVLNRCGSLLNGPSLAWYRAQALTKLVIRLWARGPGWRSPATALLAEAADLARRAG